MQGCAAHERCGPLRSTHVWRQHAQGPGFGSLWAAFLRAWPFCFCAFGFKRISCSHFQVVHLEMLPFPG